MSLFFYRFTIPSGNTDHDAHAGDGFQNVILFVLPDQSADNTFELSFNHSDFLAYHGFRYGLGKKDGVFELGVAEQPELNHVFCRNFTKIMLSRILEDAERNAAFADVLDEFFTGILFLYKQQIVNGGNHDSFEGAGFVPFFCVNHGNEIHVFFFSKESADFLFLTVKGADGKPGLLVHWRYFS